MNCTLLENTRIHQTIKSLSVVLIDETSILVKWMWNVSSKDLSSQINNYKYIYSRGNDGVSCTKSDSLQPQPDPQIKIEGLEPDSKYIICVEVSKRIIPQTDVLCESFSTQGWGMTHSIGSSVGAILALVIVMALIVLVQATRKKSANKGDSMENDAEGDYYGRPQYFSDPSYRKESYVDEHHRRASSSQRHSLSGCQPTNNYIIVPENQSLNDSDLEGIGVTLEDGTHQCNCGLVHILETLDDCIDEDGDAFEEEDNATSDQEKTSPDHIIHESHCLINEKARGNDSAIPL